MNPIVIAVGSLFAAFALGLVVRAFIVKWTENDPLTQSKAGIPGASIPNGKTMTLNLTPQEFGRTLDGVNPRPHEHEWRAVTEFVKQCRDRNCGEVSFFGDVPEGMTDYVRLMTSRKAREDPSGEASHYFEMDSRAWGPQCSNCGRPWATILDGPLWSNGGRMFNDCPYCGSSRGPKACQES